MGRCAAFASASLLVLALSCCSSKSAAQEGAAREHVIIGRLLSAKAAEAPNEFFVKSENHRFPAKTRDTSQSPVGISIVLDAGPSQGKVLEREKQTAISIIRGLSARRASYAVARAGMEGKLFSPTTAPAVAITMLSEFSKDSGKGRDVPIYDLIADAIRAIPEDSGLRVVVFMEAEKIWDRN
jgi:hypothetical protein